MKCPHCRTDYHDNPKNIFLANDIDGAWMIVKRFCPACKRVILRLINGETALYGDQSFFKGIIGIKKDFFVYPKGSSRPPCPSEVPEKFVEDYVEACLVISDSPKASAALSRRCLQHILREISKVKPNNLANEIQQVIDSRTLPSHLVKAIDAVRNIGNFAAHPLKSDKSGEILSVEPEEAEWNLDVLEALFDFYFVHPAIVNRKKKALDKKLKEAGKKPMK